LVLRPLVEPFVVLMSAVQKGFGATFPNSRFFLQDWVRQNRWFSGGSSCLWRGIVRLFSFSPMQPFTFSPRNLDSYSAMVFTNGDQVINYHAGPNFFCILWPGRSAISVDGLKVHVAWPTGWSDTVWNCNNSASGSLGGGANARLSTHSVTSPRRAQLIQSPSYSYFSFTLWIDGILHWQTLKSDSSHDWRFGTRDLTSQLKGTSVIFWEMRTPKLDALQLHKIWPANLWIQAQAANTMAAQLRFIWRMLIFDETHKRRNAHVIYASFDAEAFSNV
jgi:hypothetical protein